jgi:hypothetical protein
MIYLYSSIFQYSNITILALQKKKLIDSVNVQIKLIFVKKNIDFDRNIKKIVYALIGLDSIFTWIVT